MHGCVGGISNQDGTCLKIHQNLYLINRECRRDCVAQDRALGKNVLQRFELEGKRHKTKYSWVASHPASSGQLEIHQYVVRLQKMEVAQGSFARCSVHDVNHLCCL